MLNSLNNYESLPKIVLSSNSFIMLVGHDGRMFGLVIKYWNLFIYNFVEIKYEFEGLERRDSRTAVRSTRCSHRGLWVWFSVPTWAHNHLEFQFWGRGVSNSFWPLWAPNACGVHTYTQGKQITFIFDVTVFILLSDPYSWTEMINLLVLWKEKPIIRIFYGNYTSRRYPIKNKFSWVGAMAQHLRVWRFLKQDQLGSQHSYQRLCNFRISDPSTSITCMYTRHVYPSTCLHAIKIIQ